MIDQIPQQSLIITEIYKSIQGESSFAGLPCVFVRLTGCPLRCRWCDTAYGFEGGQQKSFEQILAELSSLDCRLVEITGGEPLAQPATPEFIRILVEQGFKVLIETGGSESIEPLPLQTHIIMDLKCPDSGMSERNRYENISHLKPTDEVKFVVASRKDFEWALAMMHEFQLDERLQVLMSPAFGLLKPAELVGWILETGLKIRLNLQLHKFIWSPRAKGV